MPGASLAYIISSDISTQNYYASAIEVPLWLGLMIVAVFILILLLRLFDKKKKVLEKFSHAKPFEKISGYESFIANNPNFSKKDFLRMALNLFYEVYHALSSRGIAKIEHKLAYGMLQRIKYRIATLSALDKNLVFDDIKVRSMDFKDIYSDGEYDFLTIMINFDYSMLSEREEGKVKDRKYDYTEYLTFIRKSELYMTSPGVCPKCGANLKRGEFFLSCPDCDTIKYYFDYFWTLYDIKQSDDYLINANTKFKTENLQEKIEELSKKNKDFSGNLITDKAIGIYIRIKRSMISGNFERLDAFASDALISKLKIQAGTRNMILDNLDVNCVSLIGIRQENNRNVLIFAVTTSFQRLLLKENEASNIDVSSRACTEIIFLERNIDFPGSKGSAYMFSCPSCGNFFDPDKGGVCEHCKAEVGDPKYEWIVTHIMDINEYRNYFMKHISDFQYKVDPRILDSAFSVKDYAFNNLMIMIAIDGVFDEKEKEFAEYIANKWKYNVDKIRPMFDMAIAGKLVIRMPEDMEKRRDIYQLMEKTAKYDGNVNPLEQKLLDEVKREYLT